jgi:hypothetical protein
MKITLNELRQMVRKIISESYNLNTIYPYYVEVTTNRIDKEYFNVEENGKLVNDVKKMIENNIDYKVTGSVNFDSIIINDFDDIYKDMYRNGYSDLIIDLEPLEEGYLYSVYENAETGKYAIPVDDNDDYFVFFAEKIQNDEKDEKEYMDEYPRNWTNPEDL